MDRFDLLTQPWIPVSDAQGRTQEVGLRECLLEAPTWRGLTTTQPTEALSLHRLLLAVLHRAVGPGSIRERAGLMDRWPRAQIDNYLQAWAGRFDLLEGDRPFLQVRGLNDQAQLKPRPWSLIALERASGNQRLLFDHTQDDRPPPVSLGVLARTLVSHLQFTPGGLVRALRTSGTRGAACGVLCTLVLGRNLSQTLTLNLLPQSPEDYAVDEPAWELEAPSIDALATEKEVVLAGPAQRYTHLSRAVLFGAAPDGGWALLYAEGLNIAVSPKADPMVALRLTERGALPVLIDARRAFWRDLHALSTLGEGHPPAVVANALTICEIRGNEDPLELLAGGLLPEKAKIVLWRLEEHRVSPRLLSAGRPAAARLGPAIEAAEVTGRSLDAAIWVLCRNWLRGPGERDPARADVTSLRLQLGALAGYWQALEPEFWALAERLAVAEDFDVDLAAWGRVLERQVLRTWNEAQTRLGRNGRALAAASGAGRAIGQAIGSARVFIPEQAPSPTVAH